MSILQCYQCDKMSTISNCHMLPIVSIQMIATSCFVTTVNAYLKREKKLWHWPSAAAAAVAAGRRHWCVPGRCGCMRKRGERESDGWWHAPRRVCLNLSSPWVNILIIGGHTQRCTDTIDGQILFQMQVLVYGGTFSNIIVRKQKYNRRNIC